MVHIKQSIVIPAYNESRRIGHTLESVADHLAKERDEFEVIVICDGCHDDTERIAKSFAGRLPLRVVSYARNRGKGYAVKRGVAVSLGRVIAFMDADGATPVRELGLLSGPIIKGDADIVIGSRRAEGATVKDDQPMLRRLLGQAFAWHTQAVLGLNIRDTQCGFKVFDGDVARALFAGLACDGFAFDLEMLAKARERGLRVLEMGVEWHDVEDSTVRPLRDGFIMLYTAWQIRMQMDAWRRTRTRDVSFGRTVLSADNDRRIQT